MPLQDAGRFDFERCEYVETRTDMDLEREERYTLSVPSPKRRQAHALAAL